MDRESDVTVTAMPEQHSKATIVSMAVIASALATLLHEGVGHGVTAWLRGDIVTELTSNHLSDVRPDRWVDAGGTIVNLIVGACLLMASRRAGGRANVRYFLFIFAALNLLPGAGYFLFSGIIGVGAFAPDEAAYNTVCRIPYYAACLFSCAAGALDPLGLKVFFLSTVPAAFGGLSGLMWADSRMPKTPAERNLLVHRSPGWWIAAMVVGASYIIVLGRGIEFGR